MTSKSWKDRLKDAAEHAKEISQEATTKAMDLSQVASVKLQEVGGQLMVEGKAKLQQALDNSLHEIESLRPILHQAGFIIRDIMFTITVPPSVKVNIRKVEECADQLNTLLADPQSGLNETQRKVLSLLARANSMSEVTSKHGYLFGEFDLVMGVPPQLTIHLVKKHTVDSA